MRSYKEDTNQNFRITFFLITFSLFVSAASNSQEKLHSSSTKFTIQKEIVCGDIASHHNAIINSAVSLPDIQEYCECTLHNTCLNPFSIQNKILDCNRRIAHNFVQIKKTWLSIRPVLPVIPLCFHLPSNKDDNLPVLS